MTHQECIEILKEMAAYKWEMFGDKTTGSALSYAIQHLSKEEVSVEDIEKMLYNFIHSEREFAIVGNFGHVSLNDHEIRGILAQTLKDRFLIVSRKPNA